MNNSLDDSNRIRRSADFFIIIFNYSRKETKENFFSSLIIILSCNGRLVREGV